MSIGTYRPEMGDCVLAYLDGAHLVRTMCWIVKEDEPGKYIALTRAASSEDTREFRFVTVENPERFTLQRVSLRDLDSREMRLSVSAAIRALAPLIR